MLEIPKTFAFFRSHVLYFSTSCDTFSVYSLEKRPAVLFCFLFSGSSRGRVDAERRFTDGSYSISDDKTAGTRHLKGYTGMIEGISKILEFDCRLRISDLDCRLRAANNIFSH